MGYIYILKLINGSYYVGSCRDIYQRLSNHKNGYVFSTKSKLPFIVVYVRVFKTYSEARKEKLRIKNWKKRSSIENLYKYDDKNIANTLAPIV